MYVYIYICIYSPSASVFRPSPICTYYTYQQYNVSYRDDVYDISMSLLLSLLLSITYYTYHQYNDSQVLSFPR